MDHRIVALVVVVLAIFCAGDAASVGDKLRIRIHAPPLSEASSVESIAATKLIGSEGSCAESSSSCSGAPIRWGESSSFGSGFGGGDAANDNMPRVDEVIGPISSWIKAFKKKIGADSGNLADAAHAIVEPLIEKLKQNQKNAEEKLEESNQAILDSVEKSVTDHVLKLLKAQRNSDRKSERTEARKAKAEAVRDEQSEREIRGAESSSMESLSASISHSASELSQNPSSKSILEHVSQELSKAKASS